MQLQNRGSGVDLMLSKPIFLPGDIKPVDSWIFAERFELADLAYADWA